MKILPAAEIALPGGKFSVIAGFFTAPLAGILSLKTHHIYTWDLCHPVSARRFPFTAETLQCVILSPGASATQIAVIIAFPQFLCRGRRFNLHFKIIHAG